MTGHNNNNNNAGNNINNNNNNPPKAPERNSDPLFVETCNSRSSSVDVKRAAIIGNPMFAFDPTSAAASAANQKQQPNQAASAGSGCDTIKLDDLNLGMDYKQLMEYFDNLKESNA